MQMFLLLKTGVWMPTWSWTSLPGPSRACGPCGTCGSMTTPWRRSQWARSMTSRRCRPWPLPSTASPTSQTSPLGTSPTWLCCTYFTRDFLTLSNANVMTKSDWLIGVLLQDQTWIKEYFLSKPVWMCYDDRNTTRKSKHIHWLDRQPQESKPLWITKQWNDSGLSLYHPPPVYIHLKRRCHFGGLFWCLPWC